MPRVLAATLSGSPGRSFVMRSLSAATLGAALLCCAAPAGASAGDLTPPDPPARMIAEWEPATGTLIRWPLGFPMALAVELAEDDTLYTLVEGAYNENQARNAFTSAGVDMEHVRFIRTSTYSMWTRDWGPQCVFGADGQMGIADPWFDGYPWVPGCTGAAPEHGDVPTCDVARAGPRGWDEDDAINADVAAALGLPLHELPGYCTGGNIMTDGHGRAFSTEQMLDENAPYMNPATFFLRIESYMGIADYQILPDPEIHGIQHIDCYAKLLDEETVLIKEVPAWHPEYDCVEDLVDAFASLTTCHGRPYTIFRVWCASYSGNDVAAYTNSLILNRKVLVPTFGIASDADALQTYEDAMPGYEVIGFYYGSWYYYDALHCRTMGIFDPGMLRITHARLPGIVPFAPEHEVTAVVEDMSQSGLVPGAQLARWRLAGASEWDDVALLPVRGDTVTGTIPGQAPGAVIEYYVTASDQSGRTEMLPRSAPDGFYAFQIDPSSGVDPGVDAAPSTLALSASPTPFRGSATLSFTLSAERHARLAIYDVRGRAVSVLLDERVPAGRHEIIWNGDSDAGKPLSAGIYFVKLDAGHETVRTTLVLLR